MSLPPLDVSVPAGLRYRLVLPEGWIRLPADPVALRPAARAMLTERFKALPRDSTARLRRQLEDELVQLGDSASGQFAVDLLLLDTEVAGRPLAASCLVSILPVPIADSEQLAALAQDAREGALRSEVLPLGRYTGVRVVRDEVSEASENQPDPLSSEQQEQVAAVIREMVGPDAVTTGAGPGASRVVDVFVPVPDAALTLLLSFSTSLRPLFEPLTELFTAIAGTVQFSYDGVPWR